MEVMVAPRAAAIALAFILGGVMLGSISGLIPGLHANNMALLLAGIAPSIPGPPLYVGMAMLAAGVVHTFLEIVPTLALGVPDPDLAVAALPGHRMVLDGHGREALRLSALGSWLAVLMALPLAIPITWTMVTLWPYISPNIPLIIGGVALILIVTEYGIRSKIVGAISFVLSAGLGLATLDIDPTAPLAAGGVLAPLFAGLFGAPVLIDAINGDGVPPQDDPGVCLNRRTIVGFSGVGTISGAIVGYLPAVSSAIASTIALVAMPNQSGAREFIVSTSSVNTSNTIFALFALVALGSPRTGILVAVETAGVPLKIGHLLIAIILAGVIGTILVIGIGDPYLRIVGSFNAAKLSISVLFALGVLSYLFAGFVGVLIYVASTIIGLVPAHFGARRANLMGVLIGPIILSV